MSKRIWILPERRKPLTRKEYAELYLRQDGRCPQCGQKLEVKGGNEVEIRDEHLNPLWRGGSNELSNRELWCKPCTRPKDAEEATQRAKVKHSRDKHIGAMPKSKNPIPGSRSTRWKKKLDGSVVER